MAAKKGSSGSHRKNGAAGGNSGGSPGGGGSSSSNAVTHRNGDSSSKSADKVPSSHTNLIQRTVWTFIMLSFFLFLMAAGHMWNIAFIFFIQVMVFNEVLAIANVPAKEKKLPWFRAMNWYFLATFLYFTYGETVIHYFSHLVFVDRYLAKLASHHRFFSFILYCIGFAIFVLNLRPGHYQFQFAQFCWAHMTLMFVIGCSHFIINNVLEGMFWFVVPVSYVIINDTFAYICGKLFGRHPLIAISPKKTREGFIGAWFFTVVLGGLLAEVLMRYKYFICPVHDLDVNMFTPIDCKVNPVFLTHTYYLPQELAGKYFFPTSIDVKPIHFHLAILSTFASLFAPFGGFFASGLKRAFKIKDFGDSIPGHGGLTDRMDCQFLNGAFVFLYYQSFIAEHHVTVGQLLQTATQSLTTEEQIELLQKLAQFTWGQGLMSKDTEQCFTKAKFISQGK